MTIAPLDIKHLHKPIWYKNSDLAPALRIPPGVTRFERNNYGSLIIGVAFQNSEIQIGFTDWNAKLISRWILESGEEYQREQEAKREQEWYIKNLGEWKP